MAHGPVYLPTSRDSSPAPTARSRWSLLLLSLLTTSAVILFYSPAASLVSAHTHRAFTPGSKAALAAENNMKKLCAQASPRMPEYNVSQILTHKDRIVEWLQGAVRIPTEVFDEMGPVDSDPKWDIMGVFQDYLKDSFPLVHSTLKRTITPAHALIYELDGTDPSLKPIFLTAHQDVVPVLPASASQWTHAPYSGDYDGEYIWGRGSSDTKSSLITILAAIEIMFEDVGTDFRPRRGVILGFGSDEERGGQVGAPSINKYIINKYGKDSISLLIDEGSGLINNWGQQFGMPAVAEKGHYDMDIVVSTLGGHSSVPPRHTGIGLASLLIAELESHPHPTILKETSPVYGYMTCAAGYASHMPPELKKTVLKTATGDKKAWSKLPGEIIATSMTGASTGAGQGNAFHAMMTTTQATDLISGGLKVNALPESVKVTVNHRVNVASDHAELEKHAIKTLLPVIKSYNLTLVAFDGKTAHHGNPTSVVTLSNAFGYYTDPSPRSPTDATDDTSAWTVMAGTARGMWASRRAVSPDGKMVELGPGDDLVMAPFMSTGNTDTRRYWDLTKNIYRFRYNPMEGSSGAHTINERTNANHLAEFARWYQAIILTMSDATNVP